MSASNVNPSSWLGEGLHQRSWALGTVDLHFLLMARAAIWIGAAFFERLKRGSCSFGLFLQFWVAYLPVFWPSKTPTALVKGWQLLREEAPSSHCD